MYIYFRNLLSFLAIFSIVIDLLFPLVYLFKKIRLRIYVTNKLKISMLVLNIP